MSGGGDFHVENSEETKRFRDNYCVLVLDSHDTCLVNLSEMLRKCGYRVMSTSRTDELLSIIDTGKINLVLADIRLIRMNNYELLQKITSYCEIAVVVAGEDLEDAADISECLCKGAEFCLKKPLVESDMKNLWQFVVRKQREFRSKSPEMQKETDDQVREGKKRKEIMGVETGEHAEKDSGFDLGDQKKPKIIWEDDVQIPNIERKEPREIEKFGEESVKSNSPVKEVEDELEKWSSHPISYFSSYVHQQFPKLDFTALESIGETKGDEVEMPLSPRESTNKKNEEEKMEDGISLADLDFNLEEGDLDSKANEDLFNEIFTDFAKDLKP